MAGSNLSIGEICHMFSDFQTFVNKFQFLLPKNRFFFDKICGFLVSGICSLPKISVFRQKWKKVLFFNIFQKPAKKF